jgi:hypothetical protein
MAMNIRKACEVGSLLLGADCEPYIPHLSFYFHTMCPHSYETWMKLDLGWLAICDAMIRLPGESAGADREEAFAEEQAIPVFYSFADFWAEHASIKALIDVRQASIDKGISKLTKADVDAAIAGARQVHNLNRCGTCAACQNNQPCLDPI